MTEYTMKTDPLELQAKQSHGGEPFTHEIWWEEDIDSFVAAGDAVAIPSQAMVEFARAVLTQCGDKHDLKGVILADLGRTMSKPT